MWHDSARNRVGRQQCPALVLPKHRARREEMPRPQATYGEAPVATSSPDSSGSRPRQWSPILCLCQLRHLPSAVVPDSPPEK